MPEKSPKSWFWPSLGWSLGVLGMIGIWVSAGIWMDAACLWMSVFSVIDIAMVLRFTGLPPGRLRFFAVLAGNVVILIASQWLIAAHAVGLPLGFYPVEAARLIGPMLAWDFTRLRIENTDGGWLLLSAALAYWMGLREDLANP